MIPLVRATVTEKDRSYLTQRLAAGLLEDDGEVRRFEEAFAQRVHAQGAVAVNSGTSALQLVLLALGVTPGDEVLIPSYTCVALLNAVAACGAAAVLVDNEYDVASARFHMSAADARRCMTSRTRAIIVSHMFGTVLDVDDFDVGLPVVEDFTLSLGALSNGRPSGSLGTVGVCSSHQSKMLSTGRGGVVVADDEALLDRVRDLSDYEQALPTWRYEKLDGLRGQFAPAFSFGMAPMQAALGISQLGQLDDFIQRRVQLARRYTDRFRAAGLVCPEVEPDHSNVFFRYMLEVDHPVSAVLDTLRNAGIEGGRGVYPPLHVLLNLSDDGFPGACRCVSRLLSVPVHPSLSDDESEYVIDQVLAAARP
ncbi:MAG: DegT/DnrJ/EryC1/StrS family aminotransferase [Solirubrobacteraceae bacterium]